MFGRDVNGRVEIRHLARYTTYDDDSLWILRRDFLLSRRWVEEVADGELCAANRMRNVDVETGVAAAGGLVFAFPVGGTGWVPEVAPVRVVDACAGADDVDGVELLEGGGEHALELRPVGHIGLEEDGSGFVSILLAVLVNELLGFWAER